MVLNRSYVISGLCVKENVFLKNHVLCDPSWNNLSIYLLWLQSSCTDRNELHLYRNEGHAGSHCTPERTHVCTAPHTDHQWEKNKGGSQSGQQIMASWPKRNREAMKQGRDMPGLEFQEGRSTICRMGFKGQDWRLDNQWEGLCDHGREWWWPAAGQLQEEDRERTRLRCKQEQRGKGPGGSWINCPVLQRQHVA